MSHRYAILVHADAPTAHTRPEDWELRREGFTLLGFAFPTLWLLFNGFWIWALLAFLLPIPFGWFSSEVYIVVSTMIGALVGFEGRERAIVSRETRGMRRVGVLEAHSRREAEDKLAALVTRGGLVLRASRAVRPEAMGATA